MATDAERLANLEAETLAMSALLGALLAKMRDSGGAQTPRAIADQAIAMADLLVESAGMQLEPGPDDDPRHAARSLAILAQIKAIALGAPKP